MLNMIQEKILRAVSLIKSSRSLQVILFTATLVAVLIFAIAGPQKLVTVEPFLDESYILTPDTLSKSAPIPVRIPEGLVAKTPDPRDSITFEPEIPGTWIESPKQGLMLYRPNAELGVGKTYQIAFQGETGSIQKNFTADENPKIEAVLPNNETESPEDSQITIVFNRPMVPLSLVESADASSLPLTLNPNTPGRWKWLSTRALQFIPKTRLDRATAYELTIGSGLRSQEGLAVDGGVFSFKTRALRYAGNSYTAPSVLHSEPILIPFNQPVDLEKTKQNISLTTAPTNNPVSFITEYGTRTVYDTDTDSYKTYRDKSIIAVYNKEDLHGRERLWNADSFYSVAVSGAVPLEGNTRLEESYTHGFSVPGYIAEITAESERSEHTAQDLFDPSGKFVIHFHEPIDKDASSIRAPGITEISYGEECKQDDLGGFIYQGTDCEKVPDKKTLKLAFDSSRFSPGTRIDIEIRKLVNTKGVSLINEPLLRTAITYPALSIRASVPANNTANASVRNLILCSTTPLKEPKEEEFYTKIRADGPIGKWNWGRPFRVNTGTYEPKCAVGEFQNTIYYSLSPERPYALSLDLQDDFSQTVSSKISLRTEKLPTTYRTLTPLQKQYNVTTPEKTKLVFSAENIEYANVHVCQVSPQTMFGFFQYDKQPKNTDPGESLPCIKTFYRRIEISDIYWRRNFFQFSLKDIIGSEPLGHFVVSIGNPEYREERYVYENGSYKTKIGGPIYNRTYITATRLAVQEKKAEYYPDYAFPEEKTNAVLSKSLGNLYWVVSTGTLLPVEGARVEAYRGSTPIASAVTNSEGIARLPQEREVTGAILSHGADSALVSENTDRFEYTQSTQLARRTYLYTDRPIYRPGDEVFIKGIDRIGYDGEYEVFRDRNAEITVTDSSYAQAFKTSVPLSSFGTFSSSFVLDAKAPLGTYRIETLAGIAHFEVEEYRPAAFKVEVKSSKDEYIAGDTADISFNAAYYFGVPVEQGTVEYSIVAQDYHFDRYEGDYYRFSSGNYYDWYYSPRDTFVTRGSLKLNAQGQGTVSKKLDFNELFVENARSSSKIIAIRSTVTNSTGQSISTEKSFIVHRGNRYVGVSMDKRFFGSKETAKVLVKTVDTEGKPAGMSGIAGTIFKTEWQSYRRQEVDGRFYYKSEEKKTAVEQFSLRTGTDGSAEFEMKPKEPGEYLVLLKGTDSAGNPIESSVDFYVAGPGYVSVRPANNETLELAVEKTEVEPGSNASFIIKSPFARGKALVGIERGKIFDYKIIDITQGLTQFSFPIKKEHAPNIYATVTLLSPDPEVKYGRLEYTVGNAHKEITLSIKPGKASYLPGEEVTLDLTATDSAGTPVSAELSLAVVDMSVLALKGNPKKDPVRFFYSGFPLAITTSSNVKNILHEAEIPAGTKGGGGGGDEASELAKKKRGLFRDTALWRAALSTDVNGKARVTFTLPDNTTAWQAETVGVTEDTRLGSAYAEFTAKKPLSVIPQFPRFIIPGDEFTIGAKVVNDTDSPLNASVSLDAQSLGSKKDATRSVRVSPGSAETVYFKVQAPAETRSGAHEFTTTAKAENHEDTVTNSIPIIDDEVSEAVATAGASTNDSATEYIFLPKNTVTKNGGLTVKAGSSLVPYLTDALRFLVTYPYGCAEQIASKLKALAIAEQFLAAEGASQEVLSSKISFQGGEYDKKDLVQIGLARIRATQQYDGGFSYYPGLAPSYPLTLHILDVLVSLRKAGYSVDTAMIDSASRFVYQKMTSPEYTSDYELFVEGANTLALVGGVWRNEPYRTFIMNRLSGIASDQNYTKDIATGSVLAHLAIALQSYGNSTVGTAVLRSLENRLSLDARGAYVANPLADSGLDYYETPAKRTALYVKARVAYKSEGALFDQILRWLRDARKKDGSWGSTNETVTVLDALKDYLTWKPEAEAQFEISSSLGGKKIGGMTISKNNPIREFSAFVPITDITSGTVVPLVFAKTADTKKDSRFYYEAELAYGLSGKDAPARDEGFSITRALYRTTDTKLETPVREAGVGEVLRARLTIVVPRYSRLVSVEDFIPAGTELVNLKLATESMWLKNDPPVGIEPESSAGFLSALGLGASIPDLPDEAYNNRDEQSSVLYVDSEELRDDRLFLFKESLYPGTYTYDYYLRSLIPGTYIHRSATVREMYRPERFGRTAGSVFATVEK